MFDGEIYIAIFGDVHGNIDKLYDNVLEWQTKNSKTIDLILQVGDLGVYDPSKDLINNKKILNKNPGETKLHEFLKDFDVLKDYFSNSDSLKKIKSRLIFVDGNHDDQEYLDSLYNNSNGPLQLVNDKLFYLLNSKPVRINFDYDIRLDFAGIGGIDKTSRPNKYLKNPSIAFTSEEVIEALTCTKLDIFLTHMYPKNGNGNGSEELTDLIQIIQPKYHFFGHHNNVSSKFNIGKTECFGLSRVNSSSLDENLKKGSLMIMKKNICKIEKFYN